MSDEKIIDGSDTATSNKISNPKVGETITAIMKPWGNILRINSSEDAGMFLVENDALVELEVKSVKISRLVLEDPVDEPETQEDSPVA